jgi:hypothetical protein
LTVFTLARDLGALGVRAGSVLMEWIEANL